MKIKEFAKKHKKAIIAGTITIGLTAVGVVIFRKVKAARTIDTLTKEAVEFTASIARDVYNVRDILLTPDVRGRDCELLVVVKDTGEFLGKLDICEAIGDRILMDLEKDVAPVFIRVPDKKPSNWIFEH